MQAPKNMTRILKWTGVAFAALFGTFFIALYLLALSFSSADIQALLNQEVRAATGRGLVIDGDINIRLGFVPKIEVTSVMLGNAAWSDAPFMLKAKRLSSHFSLFPLLEGRLLFREITLEGVSLLLETDAEGRNNWDLEGTRKAADASPRPLSSPTSSDQVRRILASLLSVTGHFDEIDIDDLTVQYIRAGNDAPSKFNIARVELEASDQRKQLALDIVGGGAKEGQILHLEVYGVADFLAGQRELRLSLFADAFRWTSQITGILRPERPSTIIELAVSLNGDDLSSIYTDASEVAPLPKWLDGLEPLLLEFRTLIHGSLEKPSLDRLSLELAGKQGTRISIDGRIKDLLGRRILEGNLFAVINDPFRYGIALFGDAMPRVAQSEANLGPLTVKGDLMGQLTAPVLTKATAAWGRKERLRAELKNLTLSFQPASLSTNLSGRPRVLLAVPNASLYFSEAGLPFRQDKERSPVGTKISFFRQRAYDFSGFAGFDMDIDVAGKLIGKGGPILDSFSMELVLERGNFVLRQFRSEIAKGELSLSGHWNVAGAGDSDMTIDLGMANLSLGVLLQRAEVADWLREAPLSGSVKGSLQGKSPSALANSFTGRIRLSLGPGKINKKIINWIETDFISNLYTSINPFSETLPYSQLECGEARLAFTDGIAVFEKGIAVETQKVAMIASGQIDLGRETLDFSLASTPKEGIGSTLGVSGIMAKLKGRFTDPKVSMDEWEVSKRLLSIGSSILTLGKSALMETVLERLTRESSLCQTVIDANASQQYN